MDRSDVGGDDLTVLAALAEPLRRRIYQYAAGCPGGVTRDDAAVALGVARSVAAFHLDKLAAAGLLDVEHRRPPGRGGPGAGRPAKWYRRADREVSASVPDRRYLLAAEVLAEAVEAAAGGVPLEDALCEAAAGCGRRLGAAIDSGSGVPAGTPSGSAPGPGPALDRFTAVLADHGYQPRRDGDVICLANCPFGALAAGHRELVCTMNLQLLQALADAAGLGPDAARLDPGPDRCCVTVAA